MQKYLIFLFLMLFPLFTTSTKGEISPYQFADDCYTTFTEINLQNIVNYTAFERAYIGYKNLKHSKDILTIIDFSKPSVEERLYVIDMKKNKLLYVSHVSHGKNSGENYAFSFSNTVGSNKSSLGFYVTENTYNGKNGYSLVLNGLEKGINDRAKQRAIVMHGADYCNPQFAAVNGRLGRSQGCPALPRELCKPIINTIKEGSLLFIYANDRNYLSHSPVLSSGQENILLTKK